MKSAYFFENWADYVKLLDDQKRLTFFDTFIKVCFEGAIPSAADGDAFLFYCLIRPAVEERDLRVKLSKSGVEARQLKRRKSATTTAVATAVDTAVDTYKRGEEKRRDEKENEKDISTALKRERESPFLPDEKVLAASPSEQNPNYPPTLQDLKTWQVNFNRTHTSIQISDADIEYFHSEMSKRNWEWVDYSTGRVEHVRRGRFQKQILQFLRGEEKKSSAARESANRGSADDAAAVPMTGAGRCAVPIATTEIV